METGPKTKLATEVGKQSSHVSVVVSKPFTTWKASESHGEGSNIVNRRGGALKRLADSKFQDKLKKGLCLQCDE